MKNTKKCLAGKYFKLCCLWMNTMASIMKGACGKGAVSAKQKCHACHGDNH